MPSDTPEFIDPLEDCSWRTPREILAGFGYTALDPSELNDQQLSGRLWELLYAAASRRFFFCSTDHLSDRGLYTLLWEEWLDEPTANIPLEAETNTTTIIAEFNAGGMTHEEIWSRYYADESDRELWRSTDPKFVFPPHQDPPFDRDRFLSTPPIPIEAHGGWLPGDDSRAEDEEPDPLGLRDIDSPNLSLEARLRAIEPENWTPPAEKLSEEEIPLLPPAEITDETLTPILWELLHNLALRGFYVLHTNHLSDSELYAALWHKGLREPAHLPGRSPRGGWFHDFLGSWGEDEMQLWLRYYATAEDRSKHAAEWPNDTIPSKEVPPFNRDWRLPKGPF